MGGKLLDVIMPGDQQPKEGGDQQPGGFFGKLFNGWKWLFFKLNKEWKEVKNWIIGLLFNRKKEILMKIMKIIIKNLKFKNR